MTSTNGTTGLVGLGGMARAKITVRALRLYLDARITDCRASYQRAMRRRTVRLTLHRYKRDHALDRAHSRAHAGESPAMTFVHQLTRLYLAGATPAELLQLAAFPLRAAEQLVLEVRTLDELDAEETALDGHEDALQMRRRIHRTRPAGVSPAALREEADARESMAALNSEAARALRAEADRMARTQGLVA